MPDCFQTEFLESAGEHFRFDETGAVAKRHEFHEFPVGLVVGAVSDDEAAECDALADALAQAGYRAIGLPGDFRPQIKRVGGYREAEKLEFVAEAFEQRSGACGFVFLCRGEHGVPVLGELTDCPYRFGAGSDERIERASPQKKVHRGFTRRGPRKKIFEGFEWPLLKFDGDSFQKSLRKAADHFQGHADEIFPLHKKSSARCVDIRQEESDAESAAFE